MQTVTYSKFKKEGTTYLQGIAGHVYGTPAGELKVGDTMVWNGGSTSTVKAIIKETKAFIWIETEYEWDGKMYTAERKLKKTRIVARPTEEMK